jgi:colanic acid biosynthesis glycosyl transferase WcaI
MMEALWKRGVPRARTVLFPNWVDTGAIHPLEETNHMRSKLKIDSETTVALYSGSVGQKQGIEILLKAAKKLETYPKMKIVLCGEGPVFNKTKSMASDLKNVLCLPLQPVEKLNHLLNLADIHLLPQRMGTADLAMPSKLAGILASGKPVVAAAGADTQISQLVHSCGIVVQPGDADAFAESLLWLARHPQERQKLGKSGRAIALKNMDKEKVLSQFENDLKGFAGR